MARKLRSDSTTAKINSFASASSDVAMPDGVDLSTEEQRMIWNQFTKTRSKDSWRDFDLVLLSKVVKLESDIRKYQGMLDKSGVLIKNKRETLVENPLIRVIDTLQRQQMAIIRSMSLNQTGSDPRTLNATGDADKNARNLINDYGIDSLIAMPQQAQ
jgi:hypothetical protein